MKIKVSPYREGMRRFWNFTMKAFICMGALIAITPLFLIFIHLIVKGYPALNLNFFTELPRPLGEDGGGVSNGIVGSMVVVGLASIMGIPMGVGVGVFLYEFRRAWTSQIVGLCTDILASVPSILVGLYAYGLWVKPTHTFSAFSAGFALAVMMVPLVARSSEEMLNRTPDIVREAGLALGIRRWKVTLRIVLRGATAGVLTGVVLSLARVAGETAPLLYTAFGNQFGFKGIFQPIATLPMQIFEYSVSPYENWQNLAWTAALVLVSMIVLINILMRVLIKTPGRGNH